MPKKNITQYNSFVKEFSQSHPGPYLFQRAGAAWRQAGDIPVADPIVYKNLLTSDNMQVRNIVLNVLHSKFQVKDAGIKYSREAPIGRRTPYLLTIRHYNLAPSAIKAALNRVLGDAGYLFQD